MEIGEFILHFITELINLISTCIAAAAASAAAVATATSAAATTIAAAATTTTATVATASWGAGAHRERREGHAVTREPWRRLLKDDGAARALVARQLAGVARRHARAGRRGASRRRLGPHVAGPTGGFEVGGGWVVKHKGVEALQAQTRSVHTLQTFVQE